MSNREMARRLGVSEMAIRTTIKRLGLKRESSSESSQQELKIPSTEEEEVPSAEVACVDVEYEETHFDAADPCPTDPVVAESRAENAPVVKESDEVDAAVTDDGVTLDERREESASGAPVALQT